MKWFYDRWRGFQSALGRFTGLSSLSRSIGRAFERHKIYLRIALLLVGFLLALWLLFFVTSTIGQTFVALKQIHPIIGWLFLVSLLVSVVLLVRMIRHLLQQAREARKTQISASLASGSFDPADPSDDSPTKLWLSSLPPPPPVSLSDLIAPGHRKLVLRLASAHDTKSYEEALQQIEAAGEAFDSDPAWLLARASLLIHTGRPLQVYPLLAEVQTRFPSSPHARDAKLLDFATRLEFSHEALVLDLSAPPPSKPDAPTPPKPVRRPSPPHTPAHIPALAPLLAPVLTPIPPTTSATPATPAPPATSATPAPPPTHLPKDDPFRDLDAMVGEIHHLRSQANPKPEFLGGEQQEAFEKSATRLSPQGPVEKSTPTPEFVGATGRSPGSSPQEPFEKAALRPEFVGAAQRSSGSSPQGPQRAMRPDSRLLSEEERFGGEGLLSLSGEAASPLSWKEARPVIRTKIRLLDDSGEIADPSTWASEVEEEADDLAFFAHIAPPPSEPEDEMIPILGGILLETALELEALLSEADNLREIGERQEARVLLDMIQVQAPGSRYAKDAKMRIVGDLLIFGLRRPSEAQAS